MTSRYHFREATNYLGCSLPVGRTFGCRGYGLPCCPVILFQVALSMPSCAPKLPERTSDFDEVAISNLTSTSSRKASYFDSM